VCCLEASKSKESQEEIINNMAYYIEKGLKVDHLSKDFKRLNLLVDMALSRPYSSDEKFSSKLIEFLKRSDLQKNDIKFLTNEANSNTKLFIKAFDKIADSNVEYITTCVIMWNLHLKHKPNKNIDFEKIYEISSTPENLIKTLDPKEEFGVLIPIMSLYDRKLIDAISSKHSSLNSTNSIDEAIEFGILTTKYNYLNRVRIGPEEPDLKSTISRKKELYTFIKEVLPIISRNINEEKMFLVHKNDNAAKSLSDIENDLNRRIEVGSIYHPDVARKYSVNAVINSKNMFECMDNLDYILIADIYQLKELSDVMKDLDPGKEMELLKEKIYKVIYTINEDMDRAIENLGAISSHSLLHN